MRVVVGAEKGVHRLIETVLLFARWCVGRNLVDVRCRVISEVAARLLATQNLLACLRDDTTYNKHHEQCEAKVRCDTQQVD